VLASEHVEPPKIIDVPAVNEPVRPERIESPGASSGAPIHPLSAVLLIFVDNLWNLADWAVIDWFLTIPLSFITVFFPVLLIQKLLKKDDWNRALGFALLLGVVAAIPTSLTGTPVGLALLAWTGISKLLGKPLQR
jgi:hypothetical protein